MMNSIVCKQFKDKTAVKPETEDDTQLFPYPNAQFSFKHITSNSYYRVTQGESSIKLHQ